MGYRIRRNKNLEESKEVQLSKKINLNEAKIDHRKIEQFIGFTFDKLERGDVRKAVDFVGTLQGWGISPEPGFEYTIYDAIKYAAKTGDLNLLIKDLKKFGYK